MARSTYYYEISKVDAVEVRNKEIMDEIKEIFEHDKGRYGVRRVHKELVNRGHNVNHSASLVLNTIAHPPGPGFSEQAPSV